MTGSCSWYGHEVVIVDVDAYVTVMDWFWFPQGSIEILKLCKANMFRLSLNRPMPNPTGNFVMAPSWKILSQLGVSKWFWSNPLIDNVSSKCDLNILEQCGFFLIFFISVQQCWISWVSTFGALEASVAEAGIGNHVESFRLLSSSRSHANVV